MSRQEQEVFILAREIVRKATEGFVFEEMSAESRKALCEAVTKQWKALTELVPPKEPEITVTMNEDGSKAKILVCFPLPYYVEAAMTPEIPKALEEPVEPIFIIVAGEGPNMQFVEVETAAGRSIRAGEWTQDGEYWKLGPFYSTPSVSATEDAPGEIGPWEHWDRPIDAAWLRRVGDELEKPMAQSRGHQKTLHVCRCLWDEVQRLRRKLDVIDE